MRTARWTIAVANTGLTRKAAHAIVPTTGIQSTSSMTLDRVCTPFQVADRIAQRRCSWQWLGIRLLIFFIVGFDRRALSQDTLDHG